MSDRRTRRTITVITGSSLAGSEQSGERFTAAEYEPIGSYDAVDSATVVNGSLHVFIPGAQSVTVLWSCVGLKSI